MEHTEKQTLNTKITTLIVKSRFVIIVALLALILAAIITGIVMYVKDSQVLAGLTTLDAIEFRYDSLDRSEATIEDDQAALISEAQALVQDSNGVVKVRSAMFVGNSSFELEKWEDARNAYITAYEADKTSYTAPLSLYNAAISSEELGELDSAIEYLEMVKDYDDFSLLSRTLFNLGRLNETSGNYQAAVDVYTELNDSYPSTTWSDLAKSRIISLTTEGKAE